MSRHLPISIILLAASTAVSAQTYTVLHYFGSKSGDPANPQLPGTIAQGRGGAMLSTASKRAYRITTSGSLLVLHTFDSGSWTRSGLILARDGMFFGTTMVGGTSGAGTVFKMSESGTVTTLHDCTKGSDDEFPWAAPIQSAEGDFYGTTTGSGSEGMSPYGSVYRITEDGSFTLLYDFTGSDGARPLGPLVQGADDYFYGTARFGGQYAGPDAYGDGTIFRVSRVAHLKVLVNFNGANGRDPYAGLIRANDGNFYGVTRFGGSLDKGVLFRMTPDGALTVLHSFSGGAEGSRPAGGLVQASDGNLYGTTEAGGKNGWGVLFRATLTGDVVPLHDFDYATGALPVALLQHTNGKLYGTTADGGVGTGPNGDGVFYSLDAGLPPFVTYLPTYGRPGAEVQILGQGFTADSVVSFNGTPAASMIVGYSTFIKAVVPDGATTGPITVTTSTGTLTSNKVFVVHPN